MKRSKVLFFFVLFFCFQTHPGVLLQSNPGKADEPALVAEPDRYDFGAILSGQVIEKKIRLRNAGTADLVIKELAFTCGCTIPEMILSDGRKVTPTLDEKGGFVVLKPGEWADLKLLFQSLGRFGKVTHRMDIHSNDPDGQVRSIPIYAEVRQAFTLDPPRLDFGLVDRNGTVERVVHVTSRVGPFRITGMENLPDYFAYQASPEKEHPDRARLTLAYKGGGPVGLHSFRAKVGVENEKVKDFALFTAIRIFPPVIFRYKGRRFFETFDLGLLEAGQAVQAEIEIVNEDLSQPYRIKACRLRSRFGSYVHARLVTEEPGMRYKVALSVDPELRTRVLRGTVILESDHPDLPVAALRFRGMYKKKGP